MAFGAPVRKERSLVSIRWILAVLMSSCLLGAQTPIPNLIAPYALNFSGWQWTSAGPPGSFSTVTFPTTGGVTNDDRLLITYNATPGTCFVGVGGTYTMAWNPAFVWDPAQRGPIRFLFASLSRSAAQSMIPVHPAPRLLLVQYGVTYVSEPMTGFTVTPNVWGTHGLLPRTFAEANFSQLVPLGVGCVALVPGTPDFSPTGAPIEVGFVDITHVNATLVGSQLSIDDFGVALYGNGTSLAMGSGNCGFGNPAPIIGGVGGFPLVGSNNFSIYVGAGSLGTAGTAAYLFLGFTDTAFAGYPLPAPLSVFGAVGSTCTLNVAVDFVLTTIIPPSLQTSIPVPIPAIPALVGYVFYGQCLVVNPFAPGAISMSPKLAVAIG